METVWQTDGCLPYLSERRITIGKAENIVEDYLRTQSKKYGFLCYKFVSPGHNGVPDDIVIHKGITTYIETKSPTGDTSEIQKLRIKEMREHGADVRICHTRKSIDKFFQEFVPNYEPIREIKPKKPLKCKQHPPAPVIHSIRT